MNAVINNFYDKVKARLVNTPNHVYVAASSWICSLVFAGLQLIIIPTLSTALGADHYAVFVIMMSLLLWFNLADFSLGYSLQNFISEQKAKQKTYDNYIFNTIFLGLIGLTILLLIIYFLAPFLGNQLLNKFGFLTNSEKSRIFLYVCSCFALTGVSAIGYKIWFAEHKGYFSNLMPAFGMIISFSVIYFFINKIEENRLLWALIVYVTPTALLGISVLLSRFTLVIKRGYKPNFDILKQIIKRAFSFWGFTFLAAITLQIDYIIMSQTLPPNDIIIYNITFRIFSLLFTIYTAILAALWPVFSESIAANKWNKVKIYLKKYLIQGISIMVGSTLVLIFLMPYIAAILVPSEKLVIPSLFIITLGIYFIFRIWTDSFAMVLNSMSKLKVFWVYIPIQAAISAYCQWTFSKAIGIYGIPLGIITSFVLTASWILPVMVFRYMKKYQAESKGT